MVRFYNILWLRLWSGGQIDNIARKYLMKELLEGKNQGLEEIKKYCENENFYNQKIKIGY